MPMKNARKAQKNPRIYFHWGPLVRPNKNMFGSCDMPPKSR